MATFAFLNHHKNAHNTQHTTHNTQHTTHNTLRAARKLILIILAFSAWSLSNAQVDPPPPNDPPCPPITTQETYCFENSLDIFNTSCSLIVCLKAKPKPAYWAVCNIIPFWDTEEHCVVLAPGERKCINLPVFSLPASQWFDVSFTVQTVGTAFVNELDAITYPELGPYQYVTPDCGNLSGHFTVFSNNGFDFTFHFFLLPGFGG